MTISPWAKFDNPVVPKINDSPTEVMAMIIASLKPLARVCGSWLSLLSPWRTSSPRKNALVVLLLALINTFSYTAVSPSGTVTPSGSVSVSRRTLYVPASSMGISKSPWASVTPSATA